MSSVDVMRIDIRMEKQVTLSTLRPACGSVHSERRLGRGQGSGYGGTSTRGHKGAQARSGYSRKVGFEGGQMPLQRRLPKFGFKSPFKVVYRVLNLEDLDRVAEALGVNTITAETLRLCGLVSRGERIKLLGRGELLRKLDVEVNAVSATARAAVEAKGGVVTLL